MRLFGQFDRAKKKQIRSIVAEMFINVTYREIDFLRQFCCERGRAFNFYCSFWRDFFVYGSIWHVFSGNGLCQLTKVSVENFALVIRIRWTRTNWKVICWYFVHPCATLEMVFRLFAAWFIVFSCYHFRPLRRDGSWQGDRNMWLPFSFYPKLFIIMWKIKECFVLNLVGSILRTCFG